MKKICSVEKGSFMLSVLFFLLLLPSSKLMASWDCDYLTISTSGTETVTYTINFVNSKNSVRNAPILIEYNTSELDYIDSSITGCLPETYGHNNGTNEYQDGKIQAWAYGMSPIPEGSTGCWIKLEFTNLVAYTPEICIWSLGDEVAGWCEILPTCCTQVIMTPKPSSVEPGETIPFEANSYYCDSFNHEWSVTTEIGSSIDPDTGLYTAGLDCFIGTKTDTVKVTDTINSFEDTHSMVFNGCAIDVRPCLTFRFETIVSKGTKKFWIIQNDYCDNDTIVDWSIDPPGTIGSTITSFNPDNPSTTGIYTAGINLTEENIGEWIYAEDTNNCCDGDCPTDSTHGTNMGGSCSGPDPIYVSPCEVKIPQNKTIGAGGSIKFNVKSNNCCAVTPDPGNYSWELSVDAGIGSSIGTSIDATGFYRAGRYLSDCTDTQETVKLTAYCPDPSNTKEVETTVTVKASKVTISSDPDPYPDPVTPGFIIQFSASTECTDNDPCYSWSLSSGGTTSGGNIDSDGLYTAGPNPGTDIVKVTDTCNYKTAHTATVTVEEAPSTTTTSPGPSTTTTQPGPSTTTIPGPTTTTTVGPTTTTTVESTTTTTISEKSIEVTPSEVKRSRWIPLFGLMYIKGTGTNFKLLKTRVEYDTTTVLTLLALVLPPEDIWQLILIMPCWVNDVWEDEPGATVTVTTDSEVVEGSFEIKMLPEPFDEEKNLM